MISKLPFVRCLSRFFPVVPMLLACAVLFGVPPARAASMEDGPPPELPELTEDAETWVREAHTHAHYGVRRGWVYMGLAFETGTGVPQDPERAVEFYRYALADGEMELAPLLLARLHGNGEGVAYSPDLADHYARLAATRLIHGFAEEVDPKILWPILPKDWKPRKRIDRAKSWLEARKAWPAEAQHDLSKAYEHGDGVPQSYDMAYFWLREAATTMSPAIQYAYGRCLLRGYCASEVAHSDPTRLEAAEMELYLAAGLGRHVEAQVGLGKKYLSGDYFVMDLARAYTWLTHAKKQGADLPLDIDALRARLSQEDFDRATAWLEDPTHFPPPASQD